MNDHLNPNDLCPGIRRTVMMLRKAGFKTTDSGDGNSNAGMGCEIEMPNVHITCEPAEMIMVATRLFWLLSAYGLDAGSDPDVDPFIQATYNPADGVAVVVSLFGVDDDALFGGP